MLDKRRLEVRAWRLYEVPGVARRAGKSVSASCQSVGLPAATLNSTWLRQTNLHRIIAFVLPSLSTYSLLFAFAPCIASFRLCGLITGVHINN